MPMNTASDNAGRTGMILILSGPSGSGKSTIYKAAIGELGGIEFSVSCTTRGPRPGEVDGRDYHFISRERFDALVAEHAFAEHAEVHGNCYGTLKSELLGRIQRGIDVLLDIDVQGRHNFARSVPTPQNSARHASSFSSCRRHSRSWNVDFAHVERKRKNPSSAGSPTRRAKWRIRPNTTTSS